MQLRFVPSLNRAVPSLRPGSMIHLPIGTILSTEHLWICFSPSPRLKKKVITEVLAASHLRDEPSHQNVAEIRGLVTTKTEVPVDWENKRVDSKRR